MKEFLASLFSYLFMIALIVLGVSLFASSVIGLRYFFIPIGAEEKELGKKLLLVAGTSFILAPVFLFLSEKLEKVKISKEDI